MSRLKNTLCIALGAIMMMVQMPIASAASSYEITARADKGAKVKSIKPEKVERGGDSKITFELDKNYDFDRVEIRDLDEREDYEVDDPMGDADLSDDTWCEVDTTRDTVTVMLKNVRSDYRVSLYTEKEDKEDDDDTARDGRVRVSVSGDRHVSLRADSGSHAQLGDTVLVTIKPDAGYIVDEVTVTIGDKTGKADADVRTVRVGERTYYLSDEPDGSRVLTLYNTGDAVRVKATSVRDPYHVSTGSADLQWYPVTAVGDAGVTAVASSPSIASGGMATITLTPRAGYQVNHIVVRAGSQSQTIAPATASRVDLGGMTGTVTGNTGNITITLYHIMHPVTVSAVSGAVSTKPQNPAPAAPPSKPAAPTPPAAPAMPTPPAPAKPVTPPITPKPDTLLIRSKKTAFLSGNGDGTMTPEAPMTRAETSAVIARLMAAGGQAQPSFSDVAQSKWYAESIGKLEKAGAYEVEKGGTFRPDEPITRAELVHWFTQIERGRTNTPCQYTDVDANTPYYKSIAYATEQGWINGYADGTFRPNASVTRAEAACMTLRIMGWSPDRTAIDKQARRFSDLPKTYWGYYEVSAASSGLYK